VFVQSALSGPESESRVRTAQLPPCLDSGITLRASPPEELGRASVKDTEDDCPGRVPPCYPFDPTLTEGPGGSVHLFYTPTHGSPLQENGAGRVVTRVWRDGRWSPPAVIAEGGENMRYMPVALSTGDGKLYVAWLQQTKGPKGYWKNAQVYGSMWSEGRWSQPGRLSEVPEVDPVRTALEPPALVQSPDGRVHVLWLDSREKRFTFSPFDPLGWYYKVYERTFNGPPDAKARQVTETGRYYASQLTPVRDREGRPAEILFFKESWTDSGWWTKGNQGIYSARAQAKGWSRSERLIPPPGSPREVEHIMSVEAVRDRAGDLIVAYRAWPLAAEAEAMFTSELRVLRRRDKGQIEIHTLARGVNFPYRRSSVQLTSRPDGMLSLAYQAHRYEWSDKFDRWVEARRAPTYFLSSDGRSCLAATQLAESTVDGLFDIEVDDAGRTHVVWVEDDGDDAVLKHRWIEVVRKPSAGSGSENAPVTDQPPRG
jgi:hypothetical protein